MDLKPINDCSLTGWLEISDVTTRVVEGEGEKPVVLGYVHTDKAYFGGRHPVVFTGDPAKIVIDHAKKRGAKNRPLISLHGYLRSHDGDSRVVVQFVRFLGPQQPDYAQIAAALERLTQNASDNGDRRKEIIKLLRQYGIPNQSQDTVQ
jgi:hypothetical protein